MCRAWAGLAVPRVRPRVRPRCSRRALSESKHRSGEDSQPKEDGEETASTLPEEKEGIETMVVDYSHGGETAVSMVPADQPLLDTPEAKNE